MDRFSRRDPVLYVVTTTVSCPDVIHRVHIVGGPGSGKTTLARRLASSLGANSYDLDEIGYEGGAGRKRPLEVRLADVRRVVGMESWVTEGVFLWWTDDLLQAADVIVWLDVPWRVAAWHIILRHMRASWAGTNRHPGLGRLVAFLRWARHYYRDSVARVPSAFDDDGAVNRAATVAHLAAFHAKVLRHPATALRPAA